MVATVEFRILGSLEITDGDRSVALRRAKPRALLAFLLLQPNQVVAADRLIEALWGEGPPPSAANTLQGYVSHLRQALAPFPGAPRIRTQAPGYALDVDPDHIDAQRFERLVRQGREARTAGETLRATEVFKEALALWRGPALADFAYEDFADAEAARLQELRLAALEEYAESELALGRHVQVISRLQALVEDHPLREPLWALLMLALYRCGRQAEALRAFQAAKRALADELGIDPCPALCRLEADILAQAPSLEWNDDAIVEGPVEAREGTTSLPFPGLLSVRSTSAGYIGRRDLLAYLTDARRQAAAGSCRAVLLAGEPGVGKTRTAAEVAEAAYAEGAIVLYGRCEEDVALPYQPFVEALDWYTRHADQPVLGRYPAELTRLQPLLPARVTGIGLPVVSDARSEEYLLFEATSSWLIELARHQPLVLVLDDLHWASKPVLLLLRHVLRAAAGDRQAALILVVGTYRSTDVEADHPLSQVVADLRALAIVDRVDIAGLTLAEVEEFVDRRVGEHDGENENLAVALHAETEGNPFFLEEMLRHLRETAAVEGCGPGRTLTDLVATTVPESVSDVVRRRIGRLSEPAVELLSLAAVLGRDVDVEVLAALRDVPEEALLDSLDEALRARLIEETGADHYRFAHALVRATLAEALSATRRRRLHRRVAEVIEKLRPDDAVALAHHYREAGPDCSSRAVRYTLAAAEQSLAGRALADAETRFRTVLDLLVSSTGDTAQERLRALCGLGEAQRDQGDSGYRATLLEAARLALEGGDVTLAVRATLSNSRGLPSVIGGLDEERLAVTEAALELVGPAPSADRARLLAQLAGEISFTREDQRRLALADEAEDMARDLRDDALLAWVLNRTGYAAFHARRVSRLVARAEEATRLSDATGDPSQRVLSRFFLSGALFTAGALPEFKRVTEDMLVVAAEAAPTLQWLARATQARLRTLEGDDAGARAVTDAAFQLAQELGEPDGPAWWAATLCPLDWHRGAFARWGDMLRAGVEQYRDEQAWRIGVALTLALDGRRAETMAVLEADPTTVDELLHHPFPFFNAQMLAVIAFHLDDAGLAARAAEVLRPEVGCWTHQYAGTMGPVSLGVALCAAVEGELDEALALCVETDRLLVHFGCRGLLPLLRLYYVEILHRRGRERDRARAAQLLEHIRADAATLGAPDLTARAEKLTAWAASMGDRAR